MRGANIDGSVDNWPQRASSTRVVADAGVAKFFIAF